jgi:23S rRNA (adenine2503-C2)-methyltransferase
VLHLVGQDSRALARKAGISLEDARRIVGAVIGRGRTLRDARNVRREVLDRVEAQLGHGDLRVVSHVDAKDGFRRYLFQLEDGARVEAVRIPLFDTHHTVCLSSQAGCALGCAFCATGRMGLTRSLASWEMVAQLLHVRGDSTRPITGVVFMGQGEPFQNYEGVLEAAYALCDPAGCRIDARRISISTAGVVPMIRRYTAEGHKFRLCVSLNAAIPWKRRALMPIEQGFPLQELVEAIREHAEARGRITLEYVMISGVNVGAEDAIALGPPEPDRRERRDRPLQAAERGGVDRVPGRAREDAAGAAHRAALLGRPGRARRLRHARLEDARGRGALGDLAGKPLNASPEA